MVEQSLLLPDRSFKVLVKKNTGKTYSVKWMVPLNITANVYYPLLAGFLSVLSVMGVAGNSLVLYVFYQKKDRLVSTLFIIVLAFVDFTTCLIVIPYTIVLESIDYIMDYDFFCKLYQFLITSNIPFSALIMVAIAIDRYLCICHPFLHALNLTRAKIMTLFMGLFSASLGVIVALMHGVYEYMDKLPRHPDFHSYYGYNQSEIHPHDMFEGQAPGMHNTSNPVRNSEPEHPMSKESRGHFRVNASEDIVNGSMDYLDLPPHMDASQIVIFMGQCRANQLIITAEFLWYYQRFYTVLYLLCLIIVVILYSLIYRSVLERRTRRALQKSKALPLVQLQNNDPGVTSAVEETLLTQINGDDKVKDEVNGCNKDHAPDKKSKPTANSEVLKRKSTRGKDNNRMANLKTAAMLFVVTVVFIITFLPAFLMALELMPYNMVVFYMYFANNVANPVIYSFMNKNFRDDLKRILCKPQVRH